MHNPDVLILDEPAANLDPRARIEFRTLIRELAGDGKTILLSSHILTELAEMCDTIAVIEHGRILATGTVAEILGRIRQGRVLTIRLAGDLSGLERFLAERPGVQHVHEAGGATARRVCGSGRRAGRAGLGRGRRRVPAARIQHEVGGPRGSLHRDHGRAAMSGSALAWLRARSDLLSPILVKEVRQMVRGREFAWAFAASLLASIAIAFMGAADALGGNTTAGQRTSCGCSGVSRSSRSRSSRWARSARFATSGSSRPST